MQKKNQPIIPDYESLQEPLVKAYEQDNQSDCQRECWRQLMLRNQIIEGLKKKGFQYPSQVQVKALPYVLKGDDVICQARAGTGKTAVFVIGVLNQIQAVNGEYLKNSCLVISPTRELAHQINMNFRALSAFFRSPKIRIGCYFGGFQINENRNDLQNQAPHIIIGTPGRLKQLTKQKLITYENCKFFVLDQCDKLFGSPSMSQDVNFILNLLPVQKQLIFTSATIPNCTKDQMKKLMKNPVDISSINGGKSQFHGLSQFWVGTNGQEQKLQKLQSLLDNLPFNQIVIFLNKIERVNFLTMHLKAKLFNPICIHSGMLQQHRIKNYDAFKKNQSKLLVATDLFGRGIDVQRVNLVINYDLPYDFETYVHRIGRAGRFGTKGYAISFVNNGFSDQRDQSSTLEQFQSKLLQKIQLLPKQIEISEFIQ